jgi:putative peptidoglycan lipid II flippase
MLPYSVIAFSIGTPYFTQLSEHVAAGRLTEVRTDLDVSIRTLGVFMVGATAVVAATAVPVSRIFANDSEAAVATAWVLGAYLVGLVPLAVLFVIQRAFYAFHDTRSPFLFTLVQAALAAATALLAGAVLPVTFLAAGIALGQSASSLIQLALAVWLLRRHTGPLQLGGTALAIARFAGAALPAALAGWLAFVLLGGADGWMLASLLTAMLAAAAIGTVVVAVYAAGLAALRAPELASVGAALRRLRR